YVAPDGSRHEYEGTTFPAPAETVKEMDRLIDILNTLASEIDPSRPWAHPRAKELDSISFRSWLEELSTDSEAIDNVSICVASGMLTGPSYTSSTLQARLVAASAGSFCALVDADFSLGRRVVGGMRSVSHKLAGSL